MADERPTHVIIAEMVAARADRDDAAILAELDAFPPFPNEDDPAWKDDATWTELHRFGALSDIAAERGLRPAIRMLLDKACHGDPGEGMRVLRHTCEAIVAGDWDELTDICLEAAKSTRSGTRMWAIHQLMILDDERARGIFEESVQSDPEEIVWIAKLGLERLDEKKSTAS